jgi:hypothetical protein
MMDDGFRELVYLAISAVIAFVVVIVVGSIGHAFGLAAFQAQTFVHLTFPFSLIGGTLAIYVLVFARRTPRHTRRR